MGLDFIDMVACGVVFGSLIWNFFLGLWDGVSWRLGES
jgi:hypothetical protein